MNTSLLNSLKRRWWVVVVLVIAGSVAGALPEPEMVEEQIRTFSATHTLLLNDLDSAESSSIAPSQVTLFIGTGEVPIRAAEALGFSGNPPALANQVESEFDFATAALTITSTQDSSERAEDVANAFADELNAYLGERQDETYQNRLATAIERLTSLETELNGITVEVARDPENPVLQAQQNAISRQYSVAFEQSQELEANPPILAFTTLERAQAVETTDSGIGAPQSRQARAILGGLVGFAVGVGLALLLGLLDRRIRSREQAEEALGLRARVLIPQVKDPDRDQLVVLPHRHDPLSDAYRTVRNIVSFVHGAKEGRERAPVTLVVSPNASDGKTSLAANLAAASAESGNRTVLVNTDFRRPRLSGIFGPTAERPLPFMIEDIDKLNGRTLLNRTGRERLRILDLSSVNAPAGELVRASASKLDEITQIADHVVIDTSPIGATAEVLDLVPYADAIVMVMRVGNGTISQAQRSIAILRDLTEVPVILVLGGVKAERTEYQEYSDRRPEPKQPGRKRFGRRRKRKDDNGELPPPGGNNASDDQDQLFDLETVE
jgi:Mrp family chromosome partitioning ATPase